MKKESLFVILIKYIAEHRYALVLFSAAFVICAAVFYLYGLESEGLFYAFGLCWALGVLIGAFRFAHYAKRYRERKRAAENIVLTAESLSKPETSLEEDYRDMIFALKKALDSEITKKDGALRESMDYYTTWIHQIKTPISVMRMILAGEDTEEHRELSSQLFRVEQYVEMVLNYIRLGGGSDFVFKEYRLDGIIKQAVHKFAPQFIRKHIGLTYESVEVKVITDEKWLSFMIEQLLSNAVKYTEKGQVTISVIEGSFLEIADTGIGIAEEDLPRIFEKGFTGYNGRADKKSTGLGLYLCRLTAERLGHKICARSEVGKGSVFTVDLRRYEVKD